MNNTPVHHSYPLLGIDISKATFDARLVLDSAHSHHQQFANDAKGFAALDRWLAQHGVRRCYAGLEATGPYGHALLWHLHSHQHAVSLLNPRHVKDFARSQGRRVKTDVADAMVIAQFLRSHQPRLWSPPAPSIAQLQALVRRRHQLMVMMGAERNRLAQAPTCMKPGIRRLIGLLRKEVVSMDKSMAKLIIADTHLQKAERLLRSIPAVGAQVAATILSEVPALSSFARARDVAAFAGLTPSIHQSGTSVRRRGAMSKEGSALLRKMLFMAALNVAKRPDNPLHATFAALVARGKAKASAIGAIMHKIIRIAFGVLKHETPFVPSLAKL